MEITNLDCTQKDRRSGDHMLVYNHIQSVCTRNHGTNKQKDNKHSDICASPAFIKKWTKTTTREREMRENTVVIVLYILILIVILDIKAFDLHFNTDKDTDRIQEMNIRG